MSAIRRNNVRVRGDGARAMVFAHGFGCDQNMWRLVAPQFEGGFKTVLFDAVGAGQSDLSAYDPEKYASLDGYADDLIEIIRELNLTLTVFVGHSVSAMVGVLASVKAPELFEKLILVGPSPRYIDDDDGYVGGFGSAQIEELLDLFDQNPMAWSQTMAPAVIGNPDRPDLAQELTESFCRTDPSVAKAFARTTFMSDNRADLAKVTTPTLILQCSDDIIAPLEVGQFIQSQIIGSDLIILDATGHCPNLSAPAEVTAAIRAYV